MTDPRAGVTEGLEPGANGVGAAVAAAGPNQQPTHVAIPIAAWKATLDTLATLPYAQVEQLIPAIQQGAPITLTGE